MLASNIKGDWHVALFMLQPTPLCTSSMYFGALRLAFVALALVKLQHLIKFSLRTIALGMCGYMRALKSEALT